MKALSKSEWFSLPSPIGEPEIIWGEEIYTIERITNNEIIIWLGFKTNWRKLPNQNWTKLTSEPNIKPNEAGIFPEGSTYFAECEEPIYEKLYGELK